MISIYRLIVTLVLAVMLIGSVHLMLVHGVGAVFSGTGDVCGSVCFREDPEKVIFIYLYNYRDWYNGSPKIQLLNF